MTEEDDVCVRKTITIRHLSHPKFLQSSEVHTTRKTAKLGSVTTAPLTSRAIGTNEAQSVGERMGERRERGGRVREERPSGREWGDSAPTTIMFVTRISGDIFRPLASCVRKSAAHLTSPLHVLGLHAVQREEYHIEENEWRVP